MTKGTATAVRRHSRTGEMMEIHIAINLISRRLGMDLMGNEIAKARVVYRE